MIDPTVAEVLHSWQGVKGQPSTRTENYDKEAKRLLDSGSTKRAIAFIRKNASAGRPFFVCVSFTHFHPPWGVHDDFENASGPGIDVDTKLEVDHILGRILDSIRSTGIEDDTTVILTGDNGAGNYPSPGIATGEVGGSNGPWRGGMSTAEEDGMRTPAMIRWPKKIAAGAVTDEIIADLDWYPTIAYLIGEEERVPTDRCIDAIDQSAFMLGRQSKSNRQHVVTYVGDTVFAVKWRSMTVHFATAEGTHSIVQRCTLPQVFDIKEDPEESFELWGNQGNAHAWVMGPVTTILADLAKSMTEYPNIKPGKNFGGYR